VNANKVHSQTFCSPKIEPLVVNMPNGGYLSDRNGKLMELSTDTDWTGDGFAIVEQSRAGLSRAKADEVARPIGLTDKEMARILNLSERTLHRLRPDARLDSNASERLLLLEVLIKHGLDVFDGRTDVLGRWLHGPLPELRRQAPVTLLDTTVGFNMVHTVLGRIEHGIYS
jgi:putative toxin-antitoxin system antitoxin component (TIGR02293 family)